ncbi:MAG TPA: hypothetical protein VND64_25465 [Pirellulales bacterium]|nr:hypothetical protein [Pirellulales bacterium]
MRSSLGFRTVCALMAFFVLPGLGNALTITAPTTGQKFNSTANISVTGTDTPNTQGIAECYDANNTVLQSTMFMSGANGSWSCTLDYPGTGWPSNSDDTIKAQDGLGGNAGVSIHIN